MPVDDEVVFHVHDSSGSSASVSQAEQFASTAEDLGYDGSVTAVTWDDGGLPSTAESNARETGGRLATYLEDYLDQNPDTAVRVLGHSMGGFVTMEMTAAPSRHQVENADMIGSDEEVDAPCEGNFYDPIASNGSGMYNYHSSNDSIARLGQEGAQCGGGGWWGSGGGGDTPDNY